MPVHECQSTDVRSVAVCCGGCRRAGVCRTRRQGKALFLLACCLLAEGLQGLCLSGTVEIGLVPFFLGKRMQSAVRYGTPLFYPILGILAATEFILAFSAFGFIVIEPVSLTFMHLPVLIGALALGPAGGLILGGIFGITSMWKASVTATALADMIFSPLLSGQPWASLVLALGTRLLFGLCAGFFFLWAVRRRRFRKAAVVCAALGADFVHKILVYGCMLLFFPSAGMTPEIIADRILDSGSCLDMGLSALVMLTVYKLIASQDVHRFAADLKFQALCRSASSPHSFFYRALFIVLFFLLALGSWSHFFSRTQMVLQMDGIVLSAAGLDRFWQVGLQFLITIIALFVVATILLFWGERYLVSVRYQARRDMMTGLYNRMTFVRLMEQSLRSTDGYLVLVDVDDFKHLNDTYGHPHGDAVLVALADILLARFAPQGIVGRLGGDEFSIYMPGTDRANMVRLAELTRRDIEEGSQRMHGSFSCSMGLVHCTRNMEYGTSYKLADQALYEAKKTGKNCFVLVEAGTGDASAGQASPKA